MHRRDVLKGFAASGALAAFGRGSRAAPAGWRRFEITYRIELATEQKPALLWVPVPQDALDYQRVVDLTWQSPVAASVLWEQDRAPRSLRLPGATRRRRGGSRSPRGSRRGTAPASRRMARTEELAEYLRPTASSPTDGIVLAKAREIVGDRTAAARQGAGDLRLDHR